MIFQKQQKIYNYHIVDLTEKTNSYELYIARDDFSEQKVLLKVYPYRNPGSVFNKLLKSQCLTIKALDHPNISRIISILEYESKLITISEFVMGKSMLDLINDVSPLTEQRACNILKQISEVSSYLYDHSIFAYQIKLANIIIESNDHVKVLSFDTLHALNNNYRIKSQKEIIKLSLKHLLQVSALRKKKNIDHSETVSLYDLLTRELPFKIDYFNGIAIRNIQREIPREKENFFFDQIIINDDQANPKKALVNDNLYIYNLSVKIKIEKAFLNKTNIHHQLVLVQGGVFNMGDSKYNAPIHQVTLNSFFINNLPVTVAGWREVMGYIPKHISKIWLNNPVSNISWYEALIFCNKLSIIKGYEPCYKINGEYNPNLRESLDSLNAIGSLKIDCNFEADGYRLPTEAEWEFSAKGGNQTGCFLYSGSNDINEVAWFSGNSNNRLHPVGTKKENELGIYDMSGNIWEYCWDIHESCLMDNETCHRINRGGCFDMSKHMCKVSQKNTSTPLEKNIAYGFRICRSFLQNIK